MTQKERTAFVRVLVDLIKADAVIDEGEMRLYAQLKRDYGIKRDDELSASTQTLAEAVAVLAELPVEQRRALLRVFDDMTVSDSFCAKQEAQLVMALRYCLGDEAAMSEVYSVYAPDVAIEDNQVVYVETAWDEAINRDIRTVYRQLDRELRLAGFNFVYIPYITSHYEHTDARVMHEVVRFLAPFIDEEQVPMLLARLTSLTTADYCHDQLCNKLGMKNLRDVPPSLLIKIGDTYVGERTYSNFLRITIDDDILPLCQRFVDEFCAMLSSDIRLVSGNEEAHGQFMYHGFYKQLFDIYVLQHGVKSRVLIDLPKEKILLPDLNVEVAGLHRRDKALYALLLMESATGGLTFNTLASSRQCDTHEVRMNALMKKYRYLYSLFNGDSERTPNLATANTRRPIISNIRRAIARLAPLLHNADDYNISKDSFGHYVVRLPQDRIFVCERVGAKPVPIGSSGILALLKAMG